MIYHDFFLWTTANTAARKNTAPFGTAARVKFTPHTVAGRFAAGRIMCNLGQTARIWRTSDDKAPIVSGVITVE